MSARPNLQPQPSKRKGMRRVVCLLLVATPAFATAGFLDELPDLEGKTIVYAGEFEQLSCPIGGRYDCTTWPIDLLKTKSGRDICLKPTSYTTCGFTCRGMIAIGKDEKPYLYVFERMGSDLKKSGFEVYKCPALH